MKEKEININIVTTSGQSYDILVAGGTPREEFFTTDDGLPGLRGRLNAIVDNIGEYFPKEEAPPAPEGAKAPAPSDKK